MDSPIMDYLGLTERVISPGFGMERMRDCFGCWPDRQGLGILAACRKTPASHCKMGGSASVVLLAIWNLCQRENLHW